MRIKKYLLRLLPLSTIIAPISISAQANNDLTKKVLEFLKLRINNSEIVQDVFNINKYLYDNSSINIDYSREFETLINYLSNQLKILFAQNEYKQDNYLFNIDYINNQEQKSFIIHINNAQKQTWDIKGKINFVNKNNFFISSEYLNAQNELKQALNNPKYKISEQGIKTLKKDIELRIQRFNNYTYTFDDNPFETKQKTIRIFDDKVDNHFEFFAPFGFDFYSENEDEKVIVNGINLEVKNKHFTFNIASIINKDENTNQWDTNTPIELKISKFNKNTGKEILSYTEKWDISSYISHSEFKLLNWNPKEQYAQFNRITKYKTTLDRKPILDQNGNQIPNSDYDPFIDPKTGVKSNLVWLNLPANNFYEQYLTAPKSVKNEFDTKLSNKFSNRDNYFLNEYYKKNNLPLGTYFYNTPKTFFENSIYQFSSPQGIVAQSISSTSGIEFQIPEDADLVLIYKINKNADELSIEPFFENGNQSYVKVLRNKDKGIENSLKNFYFSSYGTYLIASSKKGGMSNFLLLNLDEDNTKEDLVDAINKNYIQRFYDTKIGMIFSDYLSEIWKISPQKVKSLSYFDVLNYWKSFIKYSGTLAGKAKFFQSHWENNFNDIVNDNIELKTNTFDLSHTKFYKYNIFFNQAQKEFLKNDQDIDHYYSIFKSSQFTNSQAKEKIKQLSEQNDELIKQMLSDKNYIQRLNRKLFKANNLFLQSVDFTKLPPKGANDYYDLYDYELKFNSLFFNQQPITQKFILNFKSLIANYNLPDTSGISQIDKETIAIRKKFVLNEQEIDQYTQNTVKSFFNEQEFKKHFSYKWFKNITPEEFNLYTYKLKIVYQSDDINLIISVSKDNKTYLLEPYTLKFAQKDNGNIFDLLNLELINIYPFTNNQNITTKQLQDLIITQIENTFKVKKYYQVDWDIDQLSQFIDNLEKLKTKSIDQINLKLINICKSEHCFKFSKNLTLVNVAPWDLNSLKNPLIIIDDENVKDYLNYIHNELKQVFDVVKPKTFYSLEHLNLNELYLSVKKLLYSKKKHTELNVQLKPLEQYQSLYANAWNIKVLNQTTNFNYLNINDIFSFDNIVVNSDNIKDIFKQIITFLTNEDNVLDYRLNQDFTIEEIKTLLALYSDNISFFVAKPYIKLGTYQEIIFQFEQLIKSQDKQEVKDKLTVILKQIQQYETFDQTNQQVKNTLISQINQMISLIINYSSPQLTKEKQAIVNLLIDNKELPSTLKAYFLSQNNTKELLLKNISNVQLTPEQISKMLNDLDNDLANQIKKKIDNLGDEIKKQIQATKKQLEEEQAQQKLKLTIVLSIVGGVVVIGTVVISILYFKRRGKIRARKDLI
ncbi:hypothetical protein [Mycoplasma sp. 3686d]|uniref:hypothetical protein n=1 Tax=Mycoplasma sp. 3686d TaxID=2967300 RepID=UPI00211C3389|nr:hypothetical protein [Mycoplasma sp. 3686d]UUM24568.1 hypothetical protein NPA12_02600 [Mycoplasma sp. 3686d]